jgi:hypothetical protein
MSRKKRSKTQGAIIIDKTNNKRYGYGNDFNYTNKPQWDSKIENDYIDNCGMAKKPVILICQEVIGKIQFLMEKMDGEEWAADLVGNKEHKEGTDIYIIRDIYIFEQEVSSVAIKRLDEQLPEGYIGTTHSHHHLGNFMSGTDDSYPNLNHDMSGVISNEPADGLPFNMKFTMRVKTPCGKYVRFDNISVSFYVPPIEVDTSKIKKSVPVYYNNYHGQGIEPLRDYRGNDDGYTKYGRGYLDWDF